LYFFSLFDLSVYLQGSYTKIIIGQLGISVEAQYFFGICFVARAGHGIILASLFIFYLGFLFLPATAFKFSEGFQFTIVY
jgi:hypothetical protein